MGFRFQRRIKIAPGIRLNVSKSGLGLSAGIRGASISAGSRGLHGHAGIPGTGLAFRSKLSTKNQLPNQSVQEAKHRTPDSHSIIEINAVLEEDGRLQFFNAKTLEDLTESEMQFCKRHYSDKLTEMIQALCDDKNKQFETITTIHHNLPAPQEQPVFYPQKCPENRPEQPKYKKINLLAVLWPPLKKRILSHNGSLKANYASELRQYHEVRKKFEIDENNRQKLETQQIFTDVDAMGKVLQNYLSIIEWPYATEIDFDFGEDHSTLAVDVCLPDIEKFPTSRYQPLKTFSKVSIKAVNPSTKRSMYRDHIHAIAMRIIAEIYHRLPALNCVTLSGYVIGVNSATGHPEDQYLFSVKVSREQWKMINFATASAIDPVTSLAQFELRRDMTKTGIFKPISPFDL